MSEAVLERGRFSEGKFAYFDGFHGLRGGGGCDVGEQL